MSDRFEPGELESKPTGSPLFITISLLTVLNILFLSGAGLSGLHFNDDLQDEYGQTIHYDCTLCHSILAYNSDLPFKYHGNPDVAEPEYPMHLTLQQEFLREEAVY